MSTTVLPQTSAPATNRKTDRVFFPLFTLLIYIAVFIGFGPTYYRVGLVAAPLPNLLIHVHAVVFTLWLVLLALQTGLVASGRTDIHKKLGLWGFGLACVMCVVGPLAATDMLRRGLVVAGLPATTFYVIPMAGILLFAVLISAAYRKRRDPAAHKRLAMIATVAILGAAIGRWPYAYLKHGHWAGDLTLYAFLLVIVLYDLASTGRVHRATIRGSLLLIIVQQVSVPIAFTPPWQAFAHWAQGLGI